MIVDATIIASASKGDGDACRVRNGGTCATHGLKGHVGYDADTALAERIVVDPAEFRRRRPSERRYAARRAKRHVGHDEEEMMRAECCAKLQPSGSGRALRV